MSQELIELRKLAEAANTTTEQRADMQIAEYHAAWLARDAFKDAAAPAVISLLDQIQSLQVENERLTVERDTNKRMRDLHFAEKSALAAKLVPLTVERIDEIWLRVSDEYGRTCEGYESHNFARAIEAAHGIQTKGGQQ
jgi:hypothetical protein